MPHINRRIPDLGHKKDLGKENWGLDYKVPKGMFFNKLGADIRSLAWPLMLFKKDNFINQKAIPNKPVKNRTTIKLNTAKPGEFTYTQEMIKAQEARQVENQRLTQAYQKKQADESGGNRWVDAATRNTVGVGHWDTTTGKFIFHEKPESEMRDDAIANVNKSNTIGSASEPSNSQNKTEESDEVKIEPKRDRHISSVPATSRNSIRKMKRELEERFPNLDKKRKKKEEGEKDKPPDQDTEGNNDDQNESKKDEKPTAVDAAKMIENLASALAQLEGQAVGARNRETDVDLFGGYA